MTSNWSDAVAGVLRDPVLAGAFIILFAVLFAGAAWHKLGAFGAWRGALGAYRLLPSSLSGPVAVGMPVVEAAIAVALLVPASRAVAFVAAGIALLVYAVAMAAALARGITDIDCGCGGPGQRVSRPLVVRNGVLALLALMNAAPVAARALDGFDLAALLASGVALCLVGWIADELIRQAGRLNSLRAESNLVEEEK